MTVQLNSHTGIDLGDPDKLVDYVLGHSTPRMVEVRAVREQRKEDQVRNGEVCPKKIAMIYEEASKRLDDGLPPFYTVPLLEEDGVIGDPGFFRANVNHRQEVAEILNKEGRLDKYEANVLPHGFWDKLEAALGIPKKAVLTPMNPAAVDPAMEEAELFNNAADIFESKYINKDQNNLEKWLLGQRTKYTADTLKKIAKKVAVQWRAANIGNIEAKAKFRRMDSPIKDDDLRNQNAWKNKNCAHIPGDVFAINATTQGMFVRKLGEIKKAMQKKIVPEIRDPNTNRYPANRTKNSFVFHAVPKNESLFHPKDIKRNIDKKLKNMVDYALAHDEPVDGIYRYPHYLGEEDMTKPVKLWGRKEGYITDTVLEDLIKKWDEN